ncbi:iron-siderophore ABC transporter substrate-binding protein [Kineosporia sp. J2-2]|uniref:Iron-siderophore ABC transporter substrate-binding protein n=1 Tax=Kineosporia corallincola TaxID=2835133 RepID=A0ABS5TEQ0_9ACTN|nr:iron-siderophore ABC transporter substrate-binding protein [Kineosporia corallincola]MBT0769565.1 iron-siderophore ABC transporter substrate-binding protein [Kineosporia corallincola]
MSSLLPRRRSFRSVTVAVAVAALATLTACGGSSSGGDAASSDSESSSSSAFPATVSTKFGDVTIDAKPERVVALGWSDAEVALALGVQPVGASDWLGFGGEGVGPWAEGKYTTAPEIIGTLEPEYEKIAALKPDLILDTKSSGDQERYDTLSKIAPTVGIPEGADAYLTSWEDQTTLIATALGEKEQGEELVSSITAEFKKYADANPDFAGKTITVGSKTSEGYGAYVEGAGRVDFAESLGFKNNPTIQAEAKEGEFSVSVSKENMKMLDADLVVMMPIYIDATEISDDDLFKAVPAVKAGHDVVIDDKNISSAFSAESPLSIPYALEKVVPLFQDALAQ